MNRTDWDQRYAGRELVWSAEPNRVVAEVVGRLSPGRALDLGTGEGRNAIWLAEQGWRVTAVDFSQVAVERARSLAAKRAVTVDWRVADVVGFEPVEGSFDFVLLCYLHLPSPDREQVIDRVSEALAPGGTFLYVGHDARNIAEGVGGPQDPAVLTTPDAVARQLTGCRVERAEVLERPVSADTGHGGSPKSRHLALDTVVHAVRES